MHFKTIIDRPFIPLVPLFFTVTLFSFAATQQEAISHVVSYASGKVQAPTLQDYRDVGIANIEEAILPILNDAIKRADPLSVDTKKEIEREVNEAWRKLHAFIAQMTLFVLNTPTDKERAIALLSAYAESDGNSESPTLETYAKAGIVGVTAENIEEINAQIANNDASHTDTQSEIQRIVDDYLASQDTTPPQFLTDSNLSIPENTTFVADIDVNDTTRVRFAIDTAFSDSALFTITEFDGILRFLKAPNYEKPSDGDGDNRYVVAVLATDEGNNTSRREFIVSVTDDNTTADPIDMQEQNSVVYRHADSNTTFKIDLGEEEKTLYIVFTNTDSRSATNVTLTRNAKKISPVSNVRQKSVVHAKTKRTTPIMPKHAPEKIRKINLETLQKLEPLSSSALLRKRIASSPTRRERSAVGESKIFYLSTDTSEETNATLKKIVSADTAFGTKTLYVWVSNDAFDDGNGCQKQKCIDQNKVDMLASHFLQSGTDNDIYDWVTNIYGEEWGSEGADNYSNTIPESNEITILLTDIDNDNSPNGGTVGYFSGKDNLTKETYSGSNEAIMFYIDAVMYGNDDIANAYWQKETYSTLAHEFQHMINYYQHNILGQNRPEYAWLDEMLSVTTEYVVAYKLQYDGIRGVEWNDGTAGEPANGQGMFPDFNEKNDITLPAWRFGDKYDYAKVAAFGSFLVRNYGIGVLDKIVHDPERGKLAVTHAVNALTGSEPSFYKLMQRWGTGMLLSDRDDLSESMPRYNTGDFLSYEYNAITYRLGSIDFFRYDPEPSIHTENGTVEAESNYYYKVGDALNGIVELNVTVENNATEMTFIAK